MNFINIIVKKARFFSEYNYMILIMYDFMILEVRILRLNKISKLYTLKLESSATHPPFSIKSPACPTN